MTPDSGLTPPNFRHVTRDSEILANFWSYFGVSFPSVTRYVACAVWRPSIRCMRVKVMMDELAAGAAGGPPPEAAKFLSYTGSNELSVARVYWVSSSVTVINHRCVYEFPK